MGKPEINLSWSFSVNVAFLNLHDKTLLNRNGNVRTSVCIIPYIKYS